MDQVLLAARNLSVRLLEAEREARQLGAPAFVTLALYGSWLEVDTRVEQWRPGDETEAIMFRGDAVWNEYGRWRDGRLKELRAAERAKGRAR